MTLPEQVGAVRRSIHRLLTRRLSRQTRRPLQHLLAMKYIALKKVRTQAELAELLAVDAPAVSRLVDRLEEDGMVKRCAGADRRCVRLEVTEASGAEVEVLEEVVRDVDAELSQFLAPTEMRELKRLLEKLQEGLTQEQGAAERQQQME